MHFLRQVSYLLFVIVLSTTLLKGQNINNLSDSQLRQYIEEAQKRGLTEQQIEAMARARGISETDIANLRQRILGLQSGGADTTGLTQSPLRETFETAGQRAGIEMFLDSLGLQQDEEALKPFGAELFNNTNLTFAPSLNIPTPENYHLGPGDQLVIDIWGASEMTYQLTIGPEGSVKIPDLGPVFVSGLTISNASKKLLGRLAQIYSGLTEGGGRGNTFAQVSLGQIRSIKVNVVGEVNLPGTYTLSSLSTVLHALYQAGGPSESGAYRKVQVFRASQKVAEFDLYTFITKGDLSNNVVLHDQDVILVPPYETQVSISGEVKRPALFEMKENESLQDALRFAGGFTNQAYTEQLSIRRKNGFSRQVVSVREEQYATFPMKMGDEVVVSPISDYFESRVTLQGAVWRPGEFEWTKGLTLIQLLEKARGVKPDAYMERGHILRLNPDFTFKTIEFNVSEVLSGRQNVQLQNEDLVTIKSLYGLREQYVVNIQGEVRFPGAYPYSDSLTVENLIFMAGGFRQGADCNFAEVASRTKVGAANQLKEIAIDPSLKVNTGSHALQPFDMVIIRKTPNYERQEVVTVEGEVRYPGRYALASKEERISDLLKRTKGFTDYAYLPGATLIRRSEYFETGEGETSEAARIKREELRSLLERDTLLSGSSGFKTEETIGIRLDEIMKNPGSKHDLILREGDILSIPRVLETVRVRGEVLYPGPIRYNDGSSFKNYVSQAGGFSDAARVGKAYVVYANGSAERTKRFLWFKNYPDVEPGAEIIIPQKPERNRLSAQEVLGLSSAILSMVLIIDRLAN